MTSKMHLLNLYLFKPNIDIGCLFSDYTLHTYVENDCFFPPAIWAQEQSENSQ